MPSAEAERQPVPARAAKIVATILSANSESLVGEAIASVIDWVDEILLIDTGIADGTLRVASEAAGRKLRVQRFGWCNDFALARNVALGHAAAMGAAWALTVDTDERLSYPGVSCLDELRARLESAPGVLAWLVSNGDGSYAKERFIRLPTHLQWRGRTHEALVGATARQRRILPGVRFSEIAKTPEQHQIKLLRDLDVMRDETAQDPNNARWWYYLGQTLEGLGEHREAAEAYGRCYDLRGSWAEQAAWASFRAACCLVRLRDFEQALRISALGLTRQPQSPELAWMAGFCCHELGRYEDAVAWEQMAIALGNFEGGSFGNPRISFRHLSGWYEGPYDVLRFAWTKLGRKHLAAECEKKSVLPYKELRRPKAAFDAHFARDPETMLDSRRTPSGRFLRILRALCVLRGHPFPFTHPRLVALAKRSDHTNG